MKLLGLDPTIDLFRFELSKNIKRPTEIMKKCFAFTVISALALCVSQVSAAEPKKNVEANKLAREGAEAAKSQDWDKAVELLRKATALDNKYADELSAVYQRRGYADASEQKYQDAIDEYGEALKLTPKDPRIYEQRYRAYIYEIKNYFFNEMATTEKVLKLDSNNQEAKARKQRLEQKIAANVPLTPPPAAARKTSPQPARTP